MICASNVLVSEIHTQSSNESFRKLMKVNGQYNYFRFEVLAAKTVNNYIFWDIGVYFMLISFLESSSTLNMDILLRNVG